MWPFNRLRTYSRGTPVHANDLNELQDGVIHSKHGPLEIPIPLGLAIPGTAWTHDGTGWIAPDTGGAIAVPLAFAAGTDILSITVWWHLQGHALLAQGGSDYLILNVIRRNPMQDGHEFERISPSIKDGTVGDHTNGRVQFAWSLDDDPIHLRAAHLYELRVALGQAARRLDGVAVTTARRCARRRSRPHGPSGGGRRRPC